MLTHTTHSDGRDTVIAALQALALGAGMIALSVAYVLAIMWPLLGEK